MKFKLALTLTALLILPINTLIAQKEITISLEMEHMDSTAIPAFQKFAEQIAYEKKFKFRKRIRESKTSNRTFDFADNTISETEILKSFKRAARKSDNVQEFTQYFLDRDFDLIQVLDQNTIRGVYQAMRDTTFKGYVDNLERVFGSTIILSTI